MEDCTGCGLCVEICPARTKGETQQKAIYMRPQAELREAERENWEFFLSIPDLDRRRVSTGSVREMQVQRPLFEFSGPVQVAAKRLTSSSPSFSATA